MRMFDHSPWGGVSVTRSPEPVNQNLCPHVWSNDPQPVQVWFMDSEDEPQWGSGLIVKLKGRAFKCTMCDAYLVLHDRAG